MHKRIYLILASLFVCSTVSAQNLPNSSTTPAATAKKLPAAYTNTPTNFVRVYAPQKPITDTGWIKPTSGVDTVAQATTYADGYGRSLQTVGRQQSPAKKDNVQAANYDGFGRQTTQYLPFASTTNDGAFKTNPFYQDSVFYKTLFPTESINYGQSFYDGSPFNIPTKSLAPGNSWGGSNIGSTATSRSNTVADSVVLFTITNNTEDDMPVKWGLYAIGSLTVQQATDERGIKAITYSNTLGQTVLTKTQLTTSPGTGHAGWLCTYYVYDELGRARVVVPPKAVEALNTAFNFSANTAVFNNLCFVYFYDSRGRQIMKRIPGKGKSYIAYDLWDRVVMTQDPKLRLTNQWAFVLYDEQSRPDTSGIIASTLIKDSILARAARSSVYPPLSLGAYTLTSINFYDNYNWVSGTGGAVTDAFITANINSTNFIIPYNAHPHYAQEPLKGLRTRGALTGSKKIILNSSTYLYTLQYYDTESRAVQTKQTNYSGGTDVATVQYSFAGRLLRSHLAHQKSGTNAQTHTVLYKYTYDHAGRPLTVTHKLDALTEKTTTQYTYNEMGQVATKNIGAGSETQNYSYNIRGWMTGINAGYVTSTGGTNYFGETVSYDYGFATNQLNGNIAGTKWKCAGDTTARAYGYSYDNVNRLTTAYFTQANGSSWVNSTVDYTTNNLSYDANGNILTMKQRGLLLGSSSTIDSLTYQYVTTSNVLQKVIDGMPAITNSSRGDFQDTALATDDYVYDANGNIVKDNNRHMHSTANGNSAVFNVLDKADSIGIAGRSGTQYYYDAGGSLLRKQITTYGAGGSTKNYLYMAGFVYMNDTLQYALHNEGSVRYARKILSTNNSVYYAYEYDYYIKDRQGNIRTVLTEGRDTATYQATVEPALQTYENALFSNIYSPIVTWVNKSTVAAFDSDAANTKVIKLNSGGNKTGAGLTLKVMAGDKVQVNCFAYYNTATQAPSGPSLLNDILLALSSGVVNNSGGKVAAADQSAVSGLLNPNITNFLSSRNYNSSLPKAYLNWVLVDNQFKYVQGGVVQVISGSSKQALVASLQTMSKNGYLYVYVSNESPQDGYFDEITVKHYTGALVQEQSYYPFGVQMASISDKALKKAGTPYKYNAGSEMEDELEYYNTFYRKYDAQIGRFTGVDIRSEESFGMSVYNYGANNPVFFNDPLGDKYAYMDGNGNKWHGADPLRGTGGEGYQYRAGSGFDGFGHAPPGDLDAGGGGGSSSGPASRVDGGFMYKGSAAQNVFGAFLSAFKNAGEGGAWSFTVGENKNGDIGYWQTIILGTEPTPWGGTCIPLVGVQFVNPLDIEGNVRNQIAQGNYAGAYTQIFNNYPSVNQGLVLGKNYSISNTYLPMNSIEAFNTQTVLSKPITLINPKAMLNFLNGLISFGGLVRQVFHESVHARLSLGIQQGFETIPIVTGDYAKASEVIANYLMLSNNLNLPAVNNSVLMNAWGRTGITNYITMSNSGNGLYYRNYLQSIYQKLFLGISH